MPAEPPPVPGWQAKLQAVPQAERVLLAGLPRRAQGVAGAAAVMALLDDFDGAVELRGGGGPGSRLWLGLGLGFGNPNPNPNQVGRARRSG